MSAWYDGDSHYPQKFTTAFWQWFNQSYNTGMNYANRSSSGGLSNSQILRMYRYYVPFLTPALFHRGIRTGCWFVMWTRSWPERMGEATNHSQTNNTTSTAKGSSLSLFSPN